MLRAFFQHNRLHKPAGMFQLIRRERLQLGQRIGFKKRRLHGALHVGNHRLQRLFTDLRKPADLVDHSSLLAAHAKRAGLAGVFGSHRLPERPQAASLASLFERIGNRAPSSARCHFCHTRLSSSFNEHTQRIQDSCETNHTPWPPPFSLH